MTTKFEDYAVGQLIQGTSVKEATTALAVGDVRQWREQGGAPALGSHLFFAEFQDVDHVLLDMLSPRLVISPALSRRFDCVDLAVRLETLGFRGAYRAFSTDLPRPGVIDREIRSLCPSLDFAIVDLRERPESS